MGHSMSCWCCWSSKDFIFITERFADSLLVFRSMWNLTFSQLLHVRVWLDGYGCKTVWKQEFDSTWMKFNKKNTITLQNPLADGSVKLFYSLYIYIYINFSIYIYICSGILYISILIVYDIDICYFNFITWLVEMCIFSQWLVAGILVSS